MVSSEDKPAAPPPPREAAGRTPPWQHRTERLLGSGTLARLRETRVILFGVGGVGSWAAEALVRTGVGHLCLVDSDPVCITNVNRQLQASPESVGRLKVAALAERLRALVPTADIEAVPEAYGLETRERFHLERYDYVLDAIDSLSNKVGLLEHASALGRTVYSSMGASQKLDPTRIRVDSIWRTERCPLARLVRKRLRRHGFRGDFLCVYSDEPTLPLHAGAAACGTEACFCPRRVASEDAAGDLAVAHEWCSHKAQINGTVVHVTATFGMMLAGLVIQDVARGAPDPSRP